MLLRCQSADDIGAGHSAVAAVSIYGQPRYVLSQPKRENSIRLVSGTSRGPRLADAGAQQASRQSLPVLFPHTGERHHPDSVVNIHRKILKDAGLEHLKFQGLHHTFATATLQNRVDIKIASAMLGHHDARFTLCTYPTQKTQDAATITMSEIMANVI
ncbi:tyrosine-type recombinase/integrase [Oscillibacter sp. GMB15532]|uniref:tyrosine-type recombinase/integrase n=1 Tax=Oscillibacter sp. GMB15532 TaxID=3230022 RepID=UPI0034DF92A0